MERATLLVEYPILIQRKYSYNETIPHSLQYGPTDGTTVREPNEAQSEETKEGDDASFHDESSVEDILSAILRQGTPGNQYEEAVLLKL